MLVLIGDTAGHLGQSIYARDLFKLGGAAPKVDLALEKKNGDFVRALIADGTVRAAHDLSDGGLGIAAAEMALGSDVGVSLGYQGDLSDAAFLYAEDQARYLIAVAPPTPMDDLDKRARAAGVVISSSAKPAGREISYPRRFGQPRARQPRRPPQGSRKLAARLYEGRRTKSYPPRARASRASNSAHPILRRRVRLSAELPRACHGEYGDFTCAKGKPISGLTRLRRKA